jgi:hypothetical protein
MVWARYSEKAWDVTTRVGMVWISDAFVIRESSDPVLEILHWLGFFPES